jgi:hypothetical protein
MCRIALKTGQSRNLPVNRSETISEQKSFDVVARARCGSRQIPQKLFFALALHKFQADFARDIEFSTAFLGGLHLAAHYCGGGADRESLFR